MAINNEHGLTVKQMLFCKEYLKDYNGTQSAIRAGYTEKNAGVTAFDNLRRPKITQYLDLCMKEAIEEAGVGIVWRLNLAKKTAEAGYKGKTNKDGTVDYEAVDTMLTQINKMAGDYAPTTSNLNVSESNLDDAKETAEDSEKEITELKTF